MGEGERAEPSQCPGRVQGLVLGFVLGTLVGMMVSLGGARECTSLDLRTLTPIAVSLTCMPHMPHTYLHALHLPGRQRGK